MPVKTKRDEEKWQKAKEIAAKAGKAENYAYIMGIYKKMDPDYEFKSEGGKPKAAESDREAGRSYRPTTQQRQVSEFRTKIRKRMEWLLKNGSIAQLEDAIRKWRNLGIYRDPMYGKRQAFIPLLQWRLKELKEMEMSGEDSGKAANIASRIADLAEKHPEHRDDLLRVARDFEAVRLTPEMRAIYDANQLLAKVENDLGKVVKTLFRFRKDLAGDAEYATEAVYNLADQVNEAWQQLNEQALRTGSWFPGELKEEWQPGQVVDIPVEHDFDDGSQVPPMRTNQGEEIREVPSDDGGEVEYETVESIPRIAGDVEDEWERFAAIVRGAATSD